MAFAYEIVCIERSVRRRAHERIEAVCGMNNDGTPWKMSVQDAIAGIETGAWKLYFTIAGRPAWVVVAVNQDGVKYLKAEHDNEQPHLLLRLPNCPHHEKNLSCPRMRHPLLSLSAREGE